MVIPAAVSYHADTRKKNVVFRLTPLVEPCSRTFFTRKWNLQQGDSFCEEPSPSNLVQGIFFEPSSRNILQGTFLKEHSSTHPFQAPSMNLQKVRLRLSLRHVNRPSSLQSTAAAILRSHMVCVAAIQNSTHLCASPLSQVSRGHSCSSMVQEDGKKRKKFRGRAQAAMVTMTQHTYARTHTHTHARAHRL